MASLQLTARLQYAQWVAFGLANFFDKQSFHRWVLQQEPPEKGSFLDDQDPNWALIAFANFALLAGSAQLKRDASIRKVLQYYMGGFISLIIFIIADGRQESNLHLLIWAFINAFLLVIVVYVWHKEAKNVNAQKEWRFTMTLRLCYVIMCLGVALDFSGKVLEAYVDQTPAKDPAVLASRKLFSMFRIFIIGTLIAASQIDAEDQKKILQYFMAGWLTVIPRIAVLKSPLLVLQTWVGIKLNISVLLIVTHVVYGGTLEKLVIRCFYMFQGALALIGFMNTKLFLQLTSPTVDSLDAGIIIAGSYGFFCLLFAAIAQMDASSHRMALQYSLVGHLLHAYVFYHVTTGDLWTNYGLQCAVCWFLFKLLVTYREELCISSICSRFTFGLGGKSSQKRSAMRDGSQSPKRPISGGRSGTPSGKKKKKKN